MIDGTKLVAAGLLYDGDPWELVLKGQASQTVPLATVLTMSATGSEMNNGAVISRYETKEKYAFYGNYPVFSILDPETLFSLPQRQIACGLSDTFVHVLEQYMTPRAVAADGPLGRRLSGIARTLRPRSYDTMSEVHARRDARLERHDHGRVAGLGHPHDRPRADGALHGLYARRHAGHRHQRYVCCSERSAAKLLSTARRIARGIAEAEEARIDHAFEATGDLLPFAGAIDAPFGGSISARRRLPRSKRRFNAAGVRYGEAANVDGTNGPPHPLESLPADRTCTPKDEWSAGCVTTCGRP